jgi:thiamine transport system ATP-binding protein
MTVLFVTHQPEDARRIGQDVAFLDEGTIAAAGPAEDFFDRSGPDAFRRYIGDRGGTVAGSQHIARKRT